MDFIEKLETPDLPPNELFLLQGEPLLLLRNINTRIGLAKGRRCNADELGARNVVVRFDDGHRHTLPRIPMDKSSNGMKFSRWQVPLKLVFAGTVHRSQGMTLGRSVVDCRTQFWEHGQMCVALSRVRNPEDFGWISWL
jgi:ATP-dependent exoDNAse (exonuclease V) alpha subunit